jgi:hypothetical protein
VISSNYSRNKSFQSCYSKINFHLWKFEFIFVEACNYYFYDGQIFDFPTVLFDGHVYETKSLIKFNVGRKMEQPG